MAYSLAVHVIGVVFWLGGLLVLTRLLKMVLLEASLGEESRREVAKMLKRGYFGFVVAGVVLSLGSGIYQLLERGFGYYMAQGWFHGKLTLVLILLVVTVIFGAQVKGAAAGRAVKPGVVGMLHGITSGALVVIAFLTLVGRGV
jgi:putative membrane protein